MPLPLTLAQKHALAWTAIGLILMLTIWGLAPVLLPFLLAGVLAYTLHPLVERLVGHEGARRRFRLPRVVAVVLVELLALLALLALLLLVVPVLLHGIAQIREQLPTLTERFNEHVAPWLTRLGWDVAVDGEAWRELAREHFDANSEQLLGALIASARAGGSFIVALASYAILVPVVLFYLLAQWSELLGKVLRLVPPRFHAGVTEFSEEVDGVLGQYLRGQLLVMGILAVFYTVGLALFGFELAIPVGIFTGLASFIPFVGFGLGLVMAILAAVLQFGSLYGLVAVAVVYGIGQVVESVYLTPHLVGERVGLHPVAVIFALLAFGHLFGFVGVLVALPLGAIAVVALRRVQTAYVDSALYRG